MRSQLEPGPLLQRRREHPYNHVTQGRKPWVEGEICSGEGSRGANSLPGHPMSTDQDRIDGQ